MHTSVISVTMVNMITECGEVGSQSLTPLPEAPLAIILFSFHENGVLSVLPSYKTLIIQSATLGEYKGSVL